MEQLINVKYLSSCGDNNLHSVYISHFYENLNYRREYDALFHFYYIFYIWSSWVPILYKSIENWCYKQIKLTPWRFVHFDFVPNFQCWWRDFERTGEKCCYFFFVPFWCLVFDMFWCCTVLDLVISTYFNHVNGAKCLIHINLCTELDLFPFLFSCILKRKTVQDCNDTPVPGTRPLGL